MVIEQTIQLLSEDSEVSCESLLSKLDGSRKIRQDWHEFRISLSGLNNERIYELFRGPDTVFRDSCLYALYDTFKGAVNQKILRNLLRQVIPFRLTDNSLKELSVHLAEKNQKPLEPHIELADRCWNLGMLLRAAIKIKPTSRKLAILWESYKQWQFALHKLILSSTPLNRKLK